MAKGPLTRHFSNTESLVAEALRSYHWPLGAMVRELAFNGNYSDATMPGFLFLVVRKLAMPGYSQKDAVRDAELLIEKGASWTQRNREDETAKDKLDRLYPRFNKLRSTIRGESSSPRRF